MKTTINIKSWHLLIFIAVVFAGFTWGNNWIEFGKVKLNYDGVDQLEVSVNGSQIAGIDSSLQGVFLRETQQGTFHFSTNDLEIENTNANAYQIFRNDLGIQLWNNNGISSQCFQVDSATGLILMMDNQVIKVPSDTASDYDANDAIVFNQMSGQITTKSLTTAAVTSYNLTLTNSRIEATSMVFAVINSTVSNGTPMITRCSSGSGSSTITIYNAHAATALNAPITINFLVIKKH